eukprot:366297-Chlamydomonas_euryale.AAC.10
MIWCGMRASPQRTRQLSAMSGRCPASEGPSAARTGSDGSGGFADGSGPRGGGGLTGGSGLRGGGESANGSGSSHCGGSAGGNGGGGGGRGVSRRPSSAERGSGGAGGEGSDDDEQPMVVRKLHRTVMPARHRRAINSINSESDRGGGSSSAEDALPMEANPQSTAAHAYDSADSERGRGGGGGRADVAGGVAGAAMGVASQAAGTAAAPSPDGQDNVFEPDLDDRHLQATVCWARKRQWSAHVRTCTRISCAGARSIAGADTTIGHPSPWRWHGGACQSAHAAPACGPCPVSLVRRHSAESRLAAAHTMLMLCGRMARHATHACTFVTQKAGWRQPTPCTCPAVTHPAMPHMLALL